MGDNVEPLRSKTPTRHDAPAQIAHGGEQTPGAARIICDPAVQRFCEIVHDLPSSNAVTKPAPGGLYNDQTHPVIT